MEDHEPVGIYILSDSLGETADVVARAAASQFPRDTFKIVRFPKVSSAGALEEVVRSLCMHKCVFFYTLADSKLRERMHDVVSELGVPAVDILGTAVGELARATEVEPTGEVGAFRKADGGYFHRLDALEFAVKHDDGRNTAGLAVAEIVLIGASRTGKTPLAMYLAFKGYKVANIPLLPEVDPPPELFEVDRRRVFGLVSDPDLLVSIRGQRLIELGGYARLYAERDAVARELQASRAVMRQIGCVVVDTGNRAVEETAQEVIRYLES